VKSSACASAITKIQRIFGAYRAAQPSDPLDLAAFTDGKLYELFVLADLLSSLSVSVQEHVESWESDVIRWCRSRFAGAG